MDIIYTIIMGVVQGLSEFLPISSSAHLVFASNMYKMLHSSADSISLNQEIFLDIMLHFGTLIAILIFFRHEIYEIFKALLIGIKTKDYSNKDFKLGIYIIVGTIVTVFTAIPTRIVAEKLIVNPALVGLALMFTGTFLLFSEFISKKIKNKKSVSLKTAIIIGLAQGLAVIPGFSRSGLTISTGLICSVDRSIAARYSFLLSIPIILGTSLLYPIIKFDFNETLSYNWVALIIGTVVSAIVGYFCIKYFLKFVSKFSLSTFGYYCLIIGILSIVYFKI